jgi:hypothetical protein
MHEPINIIAKWLPVKNGFGTTTNVVTRLIRTDWRPPFDDLVYDRDNDGRKSKNEDDPDEIKEPIIREPVHITVPQHAEEQENLVDLVSAPTIPTTLPHEVEIQEVNDRFEWLSGALVEKLPQLETHYEGDSYVQILNDRWTDLLSTFHGESSADAVQSVNLTSADLDLIRPHEEIEDDEEGNANDDPPATPHGDLLTVASHLAEINDRGLAEVEFLPLWGQPYPVDAFALYRLPKTIGGERHSWCYRSKTETTRMALAAKIVNNDPTIHGVQMRFVLDFEPNPTNSSIVIVWVEGRHELTLYDLRSLVAAFAKARSVTRMTDIVSFADRIMGLKIGHRKHTESASKQSAADFLKRIFSTEASGKKLAT